MTDRPKLIFGWALTIGAWAMAFLAGQWSLWLAVPAFALLVIGSVLKVDAKDRAHD